MISIIPHSEKGKTIETTRSVVAQGWEEGRGGSNEQTEHRGFLGQ